MAKQVINLGTAPAGSDGDPVRTGFTKANAMFDELYTGDGTQTTAAVAQSSADEARSIAVMSGFKNKLINGLFKFSQRGASFNATGYTLDRWLYDFAGSTAVIDQFPLVAPETGWGTSEFLMRVNVTSVAGAGNFVRVRQPIEGVRVVSNGKLTVSFTALSAVAGKKIGVSIDQSFGAGGAPSALVAGNGQSVTLTSVPTEYSLTFDVPSIAGKTLGTDGGDNLQVCFWLDAGATFAPRSGAIGQQSAVVFLGRVQAEEGPNKTSFELRPTALEQMLCMRYFEKNFDDTTAPTNGAPQFLHTIGTAYGPTAMRGIAQFKVPKRIVPTVQTFSPSEITTAPGRFGFFSFVSGVWASPTSMLIDTVNKNSFVFDLNTLGATPGQSFIIAGGWAVSAEL